MGYLRSYANTLRQKYNRNPDELAQYLANVCFVHPELADEVFSGMDKYAAADLRKRFISRLSPAAQMQAGIVLPVVVWSPTTHNIIIKEAFKILENNYLEAIQRGSRRIDHESLTVPTLLEENAPQHAMTPKKKVDELKSVEKAKEWARNETKKFVKNKLNEAIIDYRKAIEGSKDGYIYWLTRAYEFFGEAMHPVMDNWSPAHRDFQIYDGSELPKGALKGAIVGGIIAGPLGSIVGAGIGGYSTTKEHSKIESRNPTEDEMNSMIDEMRLAYRMIFTKTDNAVSVAEMRETDLRIKQNGKGMLIR